MSVMFDAAAAAAEAVGITHSLVRRPCYTPARTYSDTQLSISLITNMSPDVYEVSRYVLNTKHTFQCSATPLVPPCLLVALLSIADCIRALYLG